MEFNVKELNQPTPNITASSKKSKFRIDQSAKNSIESARLDILLSFGLSKKVYDTLLKHNQTYVLPNLVTMCQSLKELGFQNPLHLIESHPTVLGLSLTNNIIPKLTLLQSLGFQNPIKMIEEFPALLGLSVANNVIPKINALNAFGFTDSIRMIERRPHILSYSLEGNIIPKIKGLESLGLRNPVQLIEKCPNLLTISLTKNIIPKLTLLRRLLKLYHLDINVLEFIEIMPACLIYSQDRMFKIAKELRDTHSLTNTQPTIKNLRSRLAKGPRKTTKTETSPPVV